MRCSRCGNEFENDKIEVPTDALCPVCYMKFMKKMEKELDAFTGIPEIEQAGNLILSGLQRVFNLDVSDPNFKDTPKRFARAYYEIFSGINSDKEIKEILSTSFPSKYGGMIVAKDIHCWSTCPHHIFPVEYTVNLGYIPHDTVLGISKLSRIVELLAKQPKLQEDFTQDIVDILEKNINPIGVIVQVSGRHLCMAMRGVKQTDSITLTSRITGSFENESTRQEFQMLLHK